MKRVMIMFFYFGYISHSFAVVFTDPAHIAHTVKNGIETVRQHKATIDQWNQNYQLVNRQIGEIQSMKEAIGDPKSAVKRVSMDIWEGNSLDYFHNQEMTYWQLKQSALATDSLLYDDAGLFKKIETVDEEGNSIDRDLDYYKRHDVIERQAQNIEENAHNLMERKKELREERDKTVRQLSIAETESEIQALNGQLLAVNGELESITAAEEDEYKKLQMQKILNEERKEKEKQASLEDFVHEESLANKRLAEKMRTIKYRSNL